MEDTLKIYKKHKIKSYINIQSVVTIHYFEFTKDYAYYGESHDFWEMVYVDKGEIIATADEREIPLRQGEAIFHKPFEFHNLRSNGISAPNVIVISFVCKDEAMKYFENKHLFVPTKYKQLISDIIAEGQTTYSLNVFDREMKDLRLMSAPVFGGSQIIKMRLEELLIRLVREMMSKQDAAEKGKESFINGKFGSTVAKRGKSVPESGSEKLSSDIIEIIKNEGIYGNINLNKICAKVNYGKTYICTRFREITGYSVMEYVNIMKISEAKKLIREKNYNFMQISSLLGFNNPHYFSKVFKKVTGLSPREYMNTVDI